MPLDEPLARGTLKPARLDQRGSFTFDTAMDRSDEP